MCTVSGNEGSKTMKNVLISGAGVAGISLAYWLRRNGFTPTVVERSRGIRDGGYKVDIRGAAVDVVKRMGVFDLVVGADGLRSNTREKVFAEDAIRDLGYRVSIFDVPNHLGLDREELTYVSPGRTVLVYSTAQDTGAKAMFLFADDAPVPADP